MKKDYTDIQHVPELGDIILVYRRKNLASWLINKIDFTPETKTNICASHIAVYLGGGQGYIAEYKFDFKFFNFKLIKENGLYLTPLKDFVSDKFIIAIRRKIGITLDEAIAIKKAIYIEISRKKKFDISGMFGILFAKLGLFKRAKNNPLEETNEEFCSSGIDAVYRMAGLDMFPDIGVGMVTPKDWAESEKLKTLLVI